MYILYGVNCSMYSMSGRIYSMKHCTLVHLSVAIITRQEDRRTPPRPRPCIPGAGIRESTVDGARQVLCTRGGIRESVNGSRELGMVLASSGKQHAIAKPLPYHTLHFLSVM